MFFLLGTVFMNAVFFGVKQEPGNESEAGISTRDVGLGSTSGAVSQATRKHVLQVSTYQVESNTEFNDYRA